MPHLSNLSVGVLLALIPTLLAVPLPAQGNDPKTLDPAWALQVRAKDGWGCIMRGSDGVFGVWFVDRQGNAQDLGALRNPPAGAGEDPLPPPTAIGSVVGAPKGFAVAMQAGLWWYGEAEPTFLANFDSSSLAAAGDRVVAAGSRNVDGTSCLYVAEVGADGAWVARDTGVRDARVLGLVRNGARWYLFVDRVLAPEEVTKEQAGKPAAESEEGMEQQAKEVWTSVDGSSWTRCAIPDSLRNKGYIGFVVPVPYRTGVAFLFDHTVLLTTGAESLETFERPRGIATERPEPNRFLAADGVYWQVEAGLLHRSEDLVQWTTWPANGKNLSLRMTGLRDGVPVTLARDAASGRLVERTMAECFSRVALGTALVPPPFLEQVTLEGAKVFGLPVWAGQRLYLPTDLGLHESHDGENWVLSEASKWPPYTYVSEVWSGLHGDQVMAWTRGGTSDAPSRLRLKPTDSPYGKQVKLTFDARQGASNGTILAFLVAPKQETYTGDGWTLQVSRDEGETWQASSSPVQYPSNLQHGPFGWQVQGTNAADNRPVVAFSDDLATWRMLPLPNRNSSLCRIGKRLVAMALPEQKGTEQGSSVSVSDDARTWTTCTLKGYGAFKMLTTGRQLWAVSNDGVCASLDGVRWHRMGQDALPGAAAAILQQDGVWFVLTMRNGSDGREVPSVWRGPAVTDEELERAPLMEAPLHEILTPQVLWARAVARADAALTLATTQPQRNDAVKNLGIAWRQAFPSASLDDSVQQAWTWFNRLVAYQLDDSSAFDAALAAGFFWPPDKRDGMGLLMKRMPEVLQEVFKDHADSLLKGTPRTKQLAQSTANPPKPQRFNALFDLQRWRERAAGGDVGAMYDLARAYSDGSGVPADGVAVEHWMSLAEARGFQAPKETLEGLEAAAATGSVYVLHLLGELLEKAGTADHDPEAALAAYRRAAASGFIPSMTNAGALLVSLARSDADAREAFDLLQRASATGWPDTLTNLGIAYEQGSGVERNLPKAVELYRRAAEAKYPQAMMLLGELLAEGKGVTRDFEAGMRMLKEAADLGDRTAAQLHDDFLNQRMHVCFRPLKSDYAPCWPAHFDVAERRKLAQQGDVAACYDLWRAYREGLGVRRNAGWARHWEARLVELGADLDAAPEAWLGRGSVTEWKRTLARPFVAAVDKEEKLAVLAPAVRKSLHSTHLAATVLLSGVPTPEQQREAMALLQWAADRGCADSLVLLGDLEARAGEPGHAKALAFFERAAALGDVQGAYKAAFLGAKLSGDLDRVVQHYLQAAYMAPMPFLGATNSFEERAEHRRRECERILEAARMGRSEAIGVAAALLCRPPAGTVARDPEEALAMAWAMKALPGPILPLVDSFADVQKEVSATGLHEVRGSAIAHEIAQRRDRQLGKDEFADLVAASSPERSMVRKAVQELLDGKLDGVLQAEQLPTQEILELRFHDSLRLEAAKHPGLRGEALLHAMVGVAAGDSAGYQRALLLRTEDMDRALLLIALRNLEVARRYHGIGCDASPVEALAWLMVDTELPGDLWRGVHWMGKDFTAAHWKVVSSQLLLLRIIKARQ